MGPLNFQHQVIADTMGPGFPAALVNAAHRNDVTDMATNQVQHCLLIQYWVTRPQPHVDRMACAWLIRRFIDPEAVIRYSQQPDPEEVTFDMKDAEFGHSGNLCSFETMMRAFNLESAGLSAMAEIVHEIDLRDARYLRPEIAGIDAILKGWALLDLPDAELEARGIALFSGLFESIANRVGS